MFCSIQKKSKRLHHKTFCKVFCVFLVILMVTGYVLPLATIRVNAVSIDVFDEESLGIALTDGADITLWSDITVAADAINVKKTSSIDLNGHVLTAWAGIVVAAGETLTIKDSQYTYENVGTGKLVATGNKDCAGIAAKDANLVINSGVITAKGGNGSRYNYGGDGIQAGEITISSGIVTAVGGIGGDGYKTNNGYKGGNGIRAKTVTIYGDEVRATGGEGGIGGTSIGSSGDGGAGISGITTIYGGIVEAYGGNCGQRKIDRDCENGIGIDGLSAIHGGTVKASAGTRLIPNTYYVQNAQGEYELRTDYIISVDIMAGDSLTITNCTLELCLGGCAYPKNNTSITNCTIFGDGALALCGIVNLYGYVPLWGIYDDSGLISGTVSFDTMGGGSVSSQTVAIGLTVDAPKEPTKEFYTFDGWCTADGKKVDFPYTVTESVTLYAKWIPYTYTVIYETNGGSPVPSQTVDYDTLINEPIIPTKTGYSFLGWYDAETGGKMIEFPYRVTEDVVFYADWTRKICKVDFDTNGGSKISSMNVYYDTKLASIPKPVWEGKQFLGWYTAKNGGTKIEFPYLVTDDVTFYARWSGISIEGDCNGDGEFSLADVVLLQKWLLAVPDTHLANWKAADLFKDDTLDVFDLVMMKRMLLTK